MNPSAAAATPMKAEGPEVAAPTATATPAADAKSRALANLLPAKALAMLAEKDKDEAGETGETAGAGAAAATSTTTTTTTGTEGDENIDLTQAGGAGDTSGEEGEPAEEDVEKLDPEQLKKKLAGKNQENAKIRKRAQEAERLRDELKQQTEKLNQELESLRSQKGQSSGGGGRLAHVSDVNVLTNLEKDAENVLEILKKQAADPEADGKYKSLTDGQEYTVDGTYLSWALATQKDVQARRDQLKDLSAAEAEASKVIKLMEKTPAYKSSLEAVKGLDYSTQRPLLEADAALGRLAREGGYVLVKKDKAAGATSPAAPAAERPIAAAHPRPEVTGTMPPVARMQEGAQANASAAKTRAMTTGRPEDIRASIAAKTKKLQRTAS